MHSVNSSKAYEVLALNCDVSQARGVCVCVGGGGGHCPLVVLLHCNSMYVHVLLVKLFTNSHRVDLALQVSTPIGD